MFDLHLIQEWFRQSLNLNSIKHLWEDLKVKVGAINCSNTEICGKQVQEEWIRRACEQNINFF